MEKIPFFELQAQYKEIQIAIDKAIAKTLNDGWFIGGNAVARFEQSFAEYIGVKHAVACANGTDALQLALQAMNIGTGDEVIVPALSWIATSGAVSATGARPVFVDIDDYYCIDVQQIEKHISPKTKAIIPVHLYGQMADMVGIMQIAQKHGLKVVEDCAQAHGASFQNKKAGSWGHVATFSFYPTKNLGAYGDAGAVLTNDEEIAEKVRRLANLGQLHQRHEHPIEGYNSRMDTLQAAVLQAKLPYLEAWNEQRIALATQYQASLKTVELPKTREGNYHVFHLYVIKSDQRDQLQAHLKAKGIATSIHYPQALPMLPCYQAQKNNPSAYLKAIEASQKALSLPLYPELTPAQVVRIIQAIHGFE